LGRGSEYYDEFAKRLALSLTVGVAYGSDARAIFKHEFDRIVQKIEAEQGARWRVFGNAEAVVLSVRRVVDRCDRHGYCLDRRAAIASEIV